MTKTTPTLLEEALSSFVEAALTSRVQTLYPHVPERDLPTVVSAIHNNMKTEGRTEEMMEQLAPHQLGSREDVQEAVSKMQWAIEGAVMGMGTDIFEPDAVERIIWSPVLTPNAPAA